MYPPEIMEALKDALYTIYWKKRQMRSFVEHCRVPMAIIQKQHWEDKQEYKAIIADKIVNELVLLKDKGIEGIRELIRRITEMEDFSHLLKEEEGKRLKKEAEVNVERLRQLVNQHNFKVRKEEQERNKRKEELEKRAQDVARFSLLDKLNDRYSKLFFIANAQNRGREFESFLFDLFKAFDLSPRGSFNIFGEQTDGFFEMDGIHFLVEAKWEKERIGAREIRAFKEQIESKLDNTLGLFISINGFTEDGITAVQRSRPNLILMDGQEFIPILSGLIDFRELLNRKIRHAAQTGDIFWHVDI